MLTYAESQYSPLCKYSLLNIYKANEMLKFCFFSVELIKVREFFYVFIKVRETYVYTCSHLQKQSVGKAP